MKKARILLLILLVAFALTVLDILLSCRSEKRPSDITPIVVKYSPQDIVYTKPDSSIVVIESIETDDKGNNTGFYSVYHYNYYGHKINERITDYSIYGKIENP